MNLLFPDSAPELLLVPSIANPRPLKRMLEKHSHSYHMLQYPDHHIFTIDDLNEIREKFRQLSSGNKIILTTEKDAVRLVKFSDEIAGLPFYVIPIRHRFLFEEGSIFDKAVTDFINNFSKRP